MISDLISYNLILERGKDCFETGIPDEYGEAKLLNTKSVHNEITVCFQNLYVCNVAEIEDNLFFKFYERNIPFQNYLKVNKFAIS